MRASIRIILKIIILWWGMTNLSAQENYLMFLNDGEEAALARIKVLEKADSELLVAYYIFEDDGIGLVALDLLLLKKELNPGVKIKVLLDGSANRVDKSLWYYLEQHGIEVREFHPSPKLLVPLKKISIRNFIRAFKNANSRMHDKILLADGEDLIIGGRNIEKTYYDLAEKNFHDRDIYFVSKSTGGEVKAYFEKLWNSKHVSKLTYNRRDRKGKHYEKMVNKLKNIRKYTLYHKKDYEEKSKAIDPVKYGMKFDKAVFLSSYNKETGKFDPDYLSTSLYKLALQLKKSFIIETPYLVPTKRLYKLMETLHKKKVKMQFVTNSFCSTDVMPVAAAYDNEKEKLAKLGVEIYEYKGPQYLHAKSAIFDDSLALVGSYNMDPRSAYINTELVFIIDDKNVVSKLASIIEEDKANSVKVITTPDFPGGYYDCTKSRADMIIYVIFKFLTRFPWLYNKF